ELEVIVDHHVERDVDGVAVVAADIVEPAGDEAAEHRQPHAAGAAERADQRAGDDRAEIDSEQAEAEEQPVRELAEIVAQIGKHADPLTGRLDLTQSRRTPSRGGPATTATNRGL